MDEDIITLYDDNNQSTDYKLLLVIDKNYQYLIYTDLDNMDISKNLYAIKINNLKSNEEAIPITEEEWNMIENTYQKLISL